MFKCLSLAPWSLAVVTSIILTVVMPKNAAAHVKWFCAFDVAGQPRGLETVLCAEFEQLFALSLVALMAGYLIERTPIGGALSQSLDLVTNGLRTSTELLFRAVCGAFFVSLWAVGGILLTPELKTSSEPVSWLQLAIAAGLIWRRTMLLSALGIVVLFGLAVRDYGAFHLMDYPVFLGVAAYLTLTSLQRAPFGIRPLDIVRWTAAVTLMWASVEKWAYPHWTFPLFLTRPEMSLGFGEEFFMRAAGMVEFALAFALVLTPLVRRIAAIMLAGAFVGAVAEFGKIDAIGHAPVAMAMLAIAADNAVVKHSKWQPVFSTLGYGAALASFLAIYYVTHSVLFGSRLT